MIATCSLYRALHPSAWRFFGAQQHFETNVVLADKKERIYYVLKYHKRTSLESMRAD